MWQQMVKKEEMEKDKSIKGALWRLVTFCYLEASSVSSDTKMHLGRLKKGIADAELSEDHPISLLYRWLLIVVARTENDPETEVKECLSLLQYYEKKSSAPVDVLIWLDRLAKALMRSENWEPAVAMFTRLLETWESKTILHGERELRGLMIDARELLARSLLRLSRMHEINVSAELLSLPGLSTVFWGSNLHAQTSFSEGHWRIKVENEKFQEDSKEGRGGQLLVFMRATTFDGTVQYTTEPNQVISLDDNWADALVVFPAAVGVIIRCEILWVHQNMLLGRLEIPIAVDPYEPEAKEDEEKK